MQEYRRVRVSRKRMTLTIQLSTDNIKYVSHEDVEYPKFYVRKYVTYHAQCNIEFSVKMIFVGLVVNN